MALHDGLWNTLHGVVLVPVKDMQHEHFQVAGLL